MGTLVTLMSLRKCICARHYLISIQSTDMYQGPEQYYTWIAKLMESDATTTYVYLRFCFCLKLIIKPRLTGNVPQ